MGIVRNLFEAVGREALTRQRIKAEGPPMTDEDLALPYVGEDEAVARGKIKLAKAVSLIAVIAAAEAGILVYAAEQKGDASPQIPIPTPRQCPVPGQQNV